MANKTLFKSLVGKLIPATDTIKEERAPAYALNIANELATEGTKTQKGEVTNSLFCFFVPFCG